LAHYFPKNQPSVPYIFPTVIDALKTKLQIGLSNYEMLLDLLTMLKLLASNQLLQCPKEKENT
jgi:hypothetical protein